MAFFIAHLHFPKTSYPRFFGIFFNFRVDWGDFSMPGFSKLEVDVNMQILSNTCVILCHNDKAYLFSSRSTIIKTLSKPKHLGLLVLLVLLVLRMSTDAANGWFESGGSRRFSELRHRIRWALDIKERKYFHFNHLYLEPQTTISKRLSINCMMNQIFT